MPIKRTRWEYLTMDISIEGFLGTKIEPQKIANLLNEFGPQGWELVSTTPITIDQGRTASILGIFKRPAA